MLLVLTSSLVQWQRTCAEVVAGGARDLPVSRPAVSQHLKVLKDAGLVSHRAVGTRRIYRLEPEGLRALRVELDRFWGKALASYKQIVEQADEEDP